MEFELLGWSDDGRTIALDHRQFSYAGKFRMSATGKAVIRDEGEIVAAASFSPDRTDEMHCWIRYLTVRNDRKGERLGSRLAATTRRWLVDTDFERVSIAVNNPFAYVACYRAGFAWTGDETGLAELVLSSSEPRCESSFVAGLNRYLATRSLAAAERSYIAARSTRGLPDRIEIPDEWLPE